MVRDAGGIPMQHDRQQLIRPDLFLLKMALCLYVGRQPIPTATVLNQSR
jgi:hypothetical protein